MELGYDSISQFLNFIFPLLMSRMVNTDNVYAYSKSESQILS